MPDHVHMLVIIPPKISISQFIGYLALGILYYIHRWYNILRKRVIQLTQKYKSIRLYGGSKIWE